MSVLDEPRVDPASDAGAADQELRRKLRRRRKILVSPILLVALVLLVRALWGAFVGLPTLAEPDAFADSAGAVGGFSGPAEPGERFTFGITNEVLTDVTMRSTRVLTTDGSAAAATTISLCRWNPAQDETTGPIGAWKGDAGEFCTDLQSVESRTFDDVGPNDNLVLTVVPLEEGEVHVTGFELDYEQGGRKGSERIDVDVRVGAPA
jgi:hypothetical protein